MYNAYYYYYLYFFCSLLFFEHHGSSSYGGAPAAMPARCTLKQATLFPRVSFPLTLCIFGLRPRCLSSSAARNLRLSLSPTHPSTELSLSLSYFNSRLYFSSLTPFIIALSLSLAASDHLHSARGMRNHPRSILDILSYTLYSAVYIPGVARHIRRFSVIISTTSAAH